MTEDATTYPANELLLAAAKNRPVQPVTEDQEAWFQQLDALSDGWDDAAFARLVALQPRRPTSITRPRPSLTSSTTPSWTGAISVTLGSPRRQIEQVLDPLVGPNADSDNRLCDRTAPTVSPSVYFADA